MVAKRKQKESKIVRRSVALPRQLVDDALAVTSLELRDNMNRLVIVALTEYIARRKLSAFEKAMEEMAHDASVVKESAAIYDEFQTAESDGLKD